MSAVPSSKRRGGSSAESTTRDQIVEHAVELFAQKGYSETSLDEIALAVGIKKPSLYHYIRTKEDLLYEIQRMLVEELLAEVEGLLATAVTPNEKIRAFFRGVVRLIARRRREMTVFINEAGPKKSSKRWREITAKRDEFQKMFEEVLDEGMRSGAFRELPLTLTALGALGAVTWAYRWYDPRGLSPDGVADLFVDIVLNGITP
jgi:AcrR family transcriptional regulator